jgi:anti-anti-sigma factor
MHQTGGCAVVVLDEATVDRGLIETRELVERRLQAGYVSLVIDITAVPRLSSTLLASLLWAHRSCQRRGGQVTLRGANRACRAVLARTGLRPLFLSPSTEEV